jgi:glycosyltransferase involved in cell wall biosynthesis
LNIDIISAALPPQVDGIGDYTAALSQQLARTARVSVLTAVGRQYTEITGVNIKPCFSVTEPRSFWRLRRHVQEDPPDWVLLQYNPFSYGRWGLNVYLPLVLGSIHRTCPKTRLAVMVHEPFVPLTNWKYLVESAWQRPQLWMLGRSADVVFFSIQTWTERLRSWCPARHCFHLPVGSNIPVVPTARSEARARLGIPDQTLVIGLFGSADRTRLLELLRAGVRAGRDAGQEVLVLYMGAQGDVVRRELGDTPLIADGPLSAREVSRRFAALDLYLAPFIDGVSTRRTSLMTSLQHGVPTIGTLGPLTDRMLIAENGRALRLVSINRLHEVYTQVLELVRDQNASQSLGREAQRFYEREFSWDRIAARLVSRLALVG